MRIPRKKKKALNEKLKYTKQDIDNLASSDNIFGIKKHAYGMYIQESEDGYFYGSWEAMAKFVELFEERAKKLGYERCN